MPKKEAEDIGTKFRESQELERRGNSLIQELAANGPIVRDLIWNEIYKENAEKMEKTGMKTFPSKAQQALNTISDDEWKAIYQINEAQMYTAEGQNFNSKGIIENSAPPLVIKALLEEDPQEAPTREQSTRSSGVLLEKIQNMSSEKLAEIYKRTGLNPNPIPQSKLEKFKEKVTDLAERIDNYVYDKAKSMGNKIESIGNKAKSMGNKVKAMGSEKLESVDKLAWILFNKATEVAQEKIAQIKGGSKNQNKGSGHSR
ncbi:MAG: hypothetical protein ACIPMY_06330 [Rickettsia endosymbiont of Pentastiridius leporinus]